MQNASHEFPGLPGIVYTNPAMKAGDKIQLENALTFTYDDVAVDTKGNKIDIVLNFSFEITAFDISSSENGVPANTKNLLIQGYKDSSTGVELHHISPATGYIAQSGVALEANNKAHITMTLWEADENHSHSTPYKIPKNKSGVRAGHILTAFEDIDIISKWNTNVPEQVKMVSGIDKTYLNESPCELSYDEDNRRYYVNTPGGGANEPKHRVYVHFENAAKEGVDTEVKFDYTGTCCSFFFNLKGYGYPGDNIDPPTKSADKTEYTPNEDVAYKIKQEFPYTDGTVNTNAKSIVVEDELNEVFDLSNIASTFKASKYDKTTGTTTDVTSKWDFSKSGQKIAFTCNDTSTAMGAITFSITPKVKTRAELDSLHYTYGTDIVNTAKTRINDIEGAPEDKRIVHDSEPVNIQINAPNLNITKSADKETAQYNDDVCFTITSKVSDADASNFKIEDTIPSELTVINETATKPKVIQGDVSLAVSGNTITATGNNDIKKGSTVEIVVPCKVNAKPTTTTSVKNIATVSATNADTKTADASVIIDPLASLSITKSTINDAETATITSVHKDDTFKYVINTTVSQGQANNFVLEDTMPSQFTINGTVIAPTGYSVDVVDNKITVSKSSVSKGTTVKVVVPARTVSGTAETVTNTASAKCDYVSEVKATKDVVIQKDPLLTIAKTSDKEVVHKTDKFNYTIEVGINSGDATNVLVKDIIPSQFTITSNPSSTLGVPTVSGQDVELKLERVAQDTSIDITIPVQVQTSTHETVKNIATTKCDYSDEKQAEVDVKIGEIVPTAALSSPTFYLTLLALLTGVGAIVSVVLLASCKKKR